MVFTVPVGVALRSGVAKKMSEARYLLRLARYLAQNKVIGLNYDKPEAMTHSVASDLLVDVPSLLSLKWRLLPRPLAHQRDPWTRQGVDAREVTMRSNERKSEWYEVALQSMLQWTKYGGGIVDNTKGSPRSLGQGQLYRNIALHD